MSPTRNGSLSSTLGPAEWFTHYERVEVMNAQPFVRRWIYALFLAFSAVGSAAAQSPAPSGAPADSIQISRSGSRAAQPGPADYFTGTVHVRPLFDATAPGRSSGALVSFDAGARSAWHTHPLGQVLIITAGKGRIQKWGEAHEEIREEDVVRIPPGVKHWHGAAPTAAMSHVAIQESQDGQVVHWLEKVSEAEYNPLSREKPMTRQIKSSGPYADISPTLDGYTQHAPGFYAGWPAANTAVEIARKAFEEATKPAAD